MGTVFEGWRTVGAARDPEPALMPCRRQLINGRGLFARMPTALDNEGRRRRRAELASSADAPGACEDQVAAPCERRLARRGRIGAVGRLEAHYGKAPARAGEI